MAAAAPHRRVRGHGLGTVDTVLSVDAVERAAADLAQTGPSVADLEALVTSAPLLAVDDLVAGYGAMEILHGVNLRLGAGQSLCLIGPNGAGKSTTFNLISGYIKPTAGTVSLRGEAISGLPPYQINRRGLSRSFQVTNVFANMTVWENLRCAVLWTTGHRYAFWKNVDNLPEVRERTAEVLSDIGLASRRDVPAGLLTYAEQRALEIGITIAGGANVILLDEPTAGMSHAETERAVTLIRRLTEGRTLMIVEHDMSVVFGLADRISVLVYGHVIATGTPEQIRADPKVKEAYLGEEAA
jgi:branched-chain amino acid transport system ATP-binding protein